MRGGLYPPALDRAKAVEAIRGRGALPGACVYERPTWDGFKVSVGTVPSGAQRTS